MPTARPHTCACPTACTAPVGPEPILCSGCVYKAVYHGEVVAAKEIDIGQSRDVQEAFVKVGGQGGPALSVTH